MSSEVSAFVDIPLRAMSCVIFFPSFYFLNFYDVKLAFNTKHNDGLNLSWERQ